MSKTEGPDAVTAYSVYFPPSTPNGNPAATCLWGHYARVLREGGIRPGRRLPPPPYRRRQGPRWREELGFGSEPKVEVSNRDSTFDLILRMRTQSWHPEQIEAALSDSANVGGAWFRWSPNEHELARCVAIADEVIAQDAEAKQKKKHEPQKKRKPRKRSSRSNKSTFAIYEVVVQRVIAFVAENPGCTTTELIAAPGLVGPTVARREGIIRAARKEALARHRIYWELGKQNRRHHFAAYDDRDEQPTRWQDMSPAEQAELLQQIGEGLEL